MTETYSAVVSCDKQDTIFHQPLGWSNFRLILIHDFFFFNLVCNYFFQNCEFWIFFSRPRVDVFKLVVFNSNKLLGQMQKSSMENLPESDLHKCIFPIQKGSQEWLNVSKNVVKYIRRTPALAAAWCAAS